MHAALTGARCRDEKECSLWSGLLPFTVYAHADEDAFFLDLGLVVQFFETENREHLPETDF